MKKLLFVIAILAGVAACNNVEKNKFTVSGKITNSNGKMVYLERVPIGTMMPEIVDSASLQKDGSFSLKTNSLESSIFNLRVDDNMYPVASVINDAPAVEVNITLNKENNQFASDYTVKGSPASITMKDFMTAFNGKLQEIFITTQKIDSLKDKNVADSIINPLLQQNTNIANSLKEYTIAEIKKSNNPALSMFELGYYQSTANNQGFGITALEEDVLMMTIDNALKIDPKHAGLASLKERIKTQEESIGSGEWVGKPAPEFILPDVNGRPVSLSSFKGKYVLVDFWASWCGPCRRENPKIVAAYNKFKDKNFTILGVSLDDSKELWLKAIQKDQLTWTHISDLKNWESVVVPLYNITGIPFNILVDPNGKIIAQGLHGSQIEGMLAKVLK